MIARRMSISQTAPAGTPPEQKSILHSRWQRAKARQPDLKKLLRLLLSFGGDFVVAPQFPDLDLGELLTDGIVHGGPVSFRQGQISGCHENVAALWNRRKREIVGVGTGYALSADGLWRQHSWGVLRDGLLETTEERVKYFGLLLQGSRADRFAGIESASASLSLSM